MSGTGITHADSGAVTPGGGGDGARGVLLLRLCGPMQAWGTQSRFSVRDTGLEPSKSGVIGLLCAALGRERDEPVADLVALRMGVRVDRPGVMQRDYQTAGGYHRREDEGYGVPTPAGGDPRTVLSTRYYLADADFLVGLAGDLDLLHQLDAALRAPVHQLMLGRRAFPPSTAVALPRDYAGYPAPLTQHAAEADDLSQLRDRLRTYPWLGVQVVDLPPRLRTPDARLRIVIDDPDGREVRSDVPLSFDERQFATRVVSTRFADAQLPVLEPAATEHEEAGV